MAPSTRRTSSNGKKRFLKFHPKPLKKKRTSMSREGFVEPSVAEEVPSEEETEEESEEPREELRDDAIDFQQIAACSEQNQIDVFVSPAVFATRQEYVTYCLFG